MKKTALYLFITVAVFGLLLQNRDFYRFSKSIYVKFHSVLANNGLIRVTYKDSPLAHIILDGLTGIEIGGSSHNPFHLNTRNVDFTDDSSDVYKKEQVAKTGGILKVDIVAPGDNLPLADNSEDFVISSHAIEHFYDPIKTVQEWLRVVKPGGYVYIIAPHKMRTFDKNRPRTPLSELIDRHEHPNPPIPDLHIHYSVWITEDFLELCRHMNWHVIAYQDVDDKVGNGFTVVIQK